MRQVIHTTRGAYVAYLLAVAVACGGCIAGQPSPERSRRSQPGTAMGVYAPDQHTLYDGHFVITGQRIYQLGGLRDPSPWNHLGDDGTNAQFVEGSITFDVNDLTNVGTFLADLHLPEGHYVVTLDSIHEFNPCQDGGIAAFIYEHGDAGCGDANWPKSLLYVAGWGYGTATLDGDTLYTGYQLHFMVTQGMRDRATLRIAPSPSQPGLAGAVNPALQQLDFYIRSPEADSTNTPGRRVFDHFVAMEVTWR